MGAITAESLTRDNVIHMAEPKHLAILNQGIGVWNEWRQSDSSVVPDLTELDLSRAALRGANFRSANLQGSNLAHAQLRESDFARAKLIGANLSDADLYQVEFYGADLQSAKLSRSILSGAKFHNANLREACLAETDLYRVDFISTNLNGTEFSGARCRQTTFAGTDLSTTKGLSQVLHEGPSYIDVSTLLRSSTFDLANFFISAGVPETIFTYIRGLALSPADFYSCFISYSHADKAFALQLYEELMRRGIRCWLDEKQLLPGDDLYEAVDKGIRLWDKVLLCCSRTSMSSWWVNNEISIALEKEQQLTRERGDRVLTIVPLDLDGHLFTDNWNSGFKAQLRARVAVSFTNWNSDGRISEAHLTRLISALRPRSSSSR